MSPTLRNFWTRNQIYGTMKDTKIVIPIKETTKEAFEAMIDFIYEVNINNWKSKSVVELFYLANLSQRYLIDEMGEFVTMTMENVPLTMETVVETAATAEEFSQFEEESSALFLGCAKFLKSQLTNVNSCLRFTARYSGTDMMATSVKLMAKLDQLNQQQPKPQQQPQPQPLEDETPLPMLFANLMGLEGLTPGARTDRQFEAITKYFSQ